MDRETAERLGLAFRRDKATNATWVSNADWNQCLGHVMFGLPQDLKVSAYGEPFTPG